MAIAWSDLARITRRELAPFDGRLAIASRTAGICALTTMVFMVYGIPLAAIACYLVLFVMKPNVSESMLMAIGITVLVAVMVLVLFGLTQLSISHPVLRMAVLALSSYLFLFLGAASKLGPAGSIVALVIAFIMTLVGDVPFGELATRAILYAWLMATVPMGVLLAVLAVFGPRPAAMVRQTIAARLHATADALTPGASRDGALARLRDGNEAVQKAMAVIRLFALLPRAERDALGQAIGSSYALLASAVAMPPQTADDEAARLRHMLAQRCSALADAIANGSACRMPDALHAELAAWPDTGPCSDIRRRLLAFPQAPDPIDPTVHPLREGFFHDDVSTNRSYAQFALKATFCAILSYVIYTALQWQDIHTAMITCYVAALGTTGETVHKLTLRIIGCLIGAAMGAAAILLLIPHMTSIGHLMLLIFAGTLVAAWVASGSERSAYAGVQIGLAFLLTILQGFGPDVSLSVAMDRIIGILLGNLILYVVFTRVWPVSAAQSAAQQLDALSQHADAIQHAPAPAAQARADLDAVLPRLDAVRQQLALGRFEPPSLQTDPSVTPALKARADDLERRYLQTAFAPDASARHTVPQAGDTASPGPHMAGQTT